MASYDPYVFNMFDEDGRAVDTAVFYAHTEDEAWELAKEYCEENGYEDFDWD